MAWRSRLPGVTAGVLVVMALLSMFSAVGLALFGGMQPVRRFVDDLVFPVPPNFAYGALLMVLAAALARRKLVAHRILLALLLVQLVGNLLLVSTLSTTTTSKWVAALGMQERPPLTGTMTFGINTVITALALAVLLVGRREFFGRATRGSLRQAIRVCGLLLGASMLLGYGLVAVFPGSLDDPVDKVTWTVERVLGGAIVFDITRVGHAPGWVNLVLGLFGAAVLFTGLFLLLRAQRVASRLSPEDERRIRLLLAESGERDSLGYFATRRDKSALFSPGGKAAITYRVVAGVCLASGDPLGDPEAWQPAIDRWVAMCREYTWTPAAIGAGERGAAAYNRAGLRVLRLGDEAVLDAKAFHLDGPEMRPVRQAVNRVQRAGHTTRIRRHAEIPAGEMAEIAHLAEKWRDTTTERGFSMALGRLGDPRDQDCVLVEALDQHGTTVALLSLTPWGRRGLSLDVMRRDGRADNGVIEFMVSTLMRDSGRLGVQRVSLNFAVFRAAFQEGARIGAGPVLRAWRGLLVFVSRWWQLESLYRSNVKYRPHWVPRFVAFDERRDLARVGVASAMAEGFLPVPGRGSRTPVSQPLIDAEIRSPHQADPPERSPRVPEQTRIRMDKVAALREGGSDPYPVEVPRAEHCARIAERHRELLPNARTGQSTSTAGRVVLLRDHGGVYFATLRDWSGDLQAMLTRSESGEDQLRSWRALVDIGDQVSVEGEVVTSRHGELSVLVSNWTMAAKCLRPLPDKHRGRTAPESRVRQRYLDLIERTSTRATLVSRSAAVHALRDTLVRSNFLEVETPVLQPVHGGANARPFATHINAYDMPLFLRIAPELYLKRLCVGGVDRLFEIGRAFRNEGVSHKHNPEFTMLEAYQAFTDYRAMRDLCRRLVQAAAEAANGRHTARDGSEEVDLGGDWPVVPVTEAVSAAIGEEITAETSLARLRKACAAAHVAYERNWTGGEVLVEMYERLVEPRTTRPTFYTDFPVEVAPLTRAHRHDGRLAERWDLVALGVELGTGYSELTDPVEQRRRLTAQSQVGANGDPEAMAVDEDFLTALDHAMPPTGGMGLGVDRLIMLLTGGSIRETLPFPLVRPSRR